MTQEPNRTPDAAPVVDERLLLTVAVIGGTGREGSGLAMRWALNGYRVIVGSRDTEKAKARAAELNAQLGGDYLIGMGNEEAAQQGDLIALTVPYTAHKDTLLSIRDAIAGKILIDITVPLQPPKVRTVNLPAGKAAALEAREYLGEGVRIVSAFQNISSEKMVDANALVDCDVLVTGDDADAKAEVIRLVEAAGMRGIDAGSLANAVAVESLTPVLLYINKKYGVVGSGIRITGIDTAPKSE